MTVRTFSISAGLEASTVTPGRTAPVASRATPAMLPLVADCADASVDHEDAHSTIPITSLLITPPPSNSSANPNSRGSRRENALAHHKLNEHSISAPTEYSSRVVCQ